MKTEPFVHFLKTASIANYKVGIAYKDGDLEYLDEGPIDGKYYALNDWATLWVSSEDKITLITLYVKGREFKIYMTATYGLKVFNLKRVLNFLEQYCIQWVIDEDWTHDKQLTIKLKSGVQFYFALNRQLEYILTDISIANYDS